MKSPHHTRKLWSAFAGVLLLTIAAMTADRLQLLSSVRVTLHDALSPGRLVVAAISGDSKSPVAAAVDPKMQSLETRLRDVEQQSRQLLIENAQLHNRLRQLKQSKGHSGRHAPLAGFELISARVLSRNGMPSGLRQAMIDAGRAHGLTRSELVLDTRGILLDQGVQNGVSDGRSVLAGSVVLGRVDQAGRWVSHLLPITDESFSARIRLVRRSSRGTHQGAEGMLQGTGKACRVIGIPDTASVAVGDEVFSADIDGIAGPRLYYGTIVVAEFEAAGEWSLEVKPAGILSEIEEVAIVVPKLNLAAKPATGERTMRQANQ
jgi:cell shape-determining protein MreC